MASISCRHIYKIYPGNVTAVKDFNLEIRIRNLSFSSALPAAASPPPCV